VILAQFLAHAPGGAPNAPDAKIVQLPWGFVRNLFCANMCAKPHPTTLRERSGVVVLAHAPFLNSAPCASPLAVLILSLGYTDMGDRQRQHTMVRRRRFHPRNSLPALSRPVLV
jgi:hypothetical protein